MVNASRVKRYLVSSFFILFVIIYPFVMVDPFFRWQTMIVCIFGTLAVGLNVLTGVTGLISLGHAGFYAISAYTGALMGIKLGLGFFPILVISTMLTAFVGAILAYATLRVSGVYFAMVTIAFGLVVKNIAMEWQGMTMGPTGLDGIPPVRFLGYFFSEQAYMYLLAFTFIAVIYIGKNLVNSKFGRGFKAVYMSQLGAGSSGIHPLRIRMVATVFAAACAGVAGHYFAYLNLYLSPDIFTFDLSILFLLIVIFGGLGTVLGPIVGTVFLVLLPEFLQYLMQYRMIVYGALLLFVINLMPRGAVGSIHILLEKVFPKFFQPEPINVSGQGGWLKESSIMSQVQRPEKTQRSDDVLVEARDITVRFGGLYALTDFSMNIKRNSIHALIGPNGAGKTTFINVISGIYSPTSGEVIYNGNAVHNKPDWSVARSGIARTFQTTQLFSDMKIYENVMVGFHEQIDYGITGAILSTRGMEEEEKVLKNRALELLDFVGFRGDANNLAKNLPFGHQRLVEIAKALALNPTLLLMDEPAAGLTGKEIDDLDDVINRIQKLGTTILLIEHHVELVMGVSDTITVLVYGEKLSEGNPDEVRRDPAVIEAYLGGTV